MFKSDEELKHFVAAAPWVGGARLTGFTVQPHITAKDDDGGAWLGAELKFMIKDTIKGDALAPDSEIIITVLVPDRPDVVNWGTGVFGRNPAKIILVDPKNPKDSARPYYERVFTDGELPRAQLQKIGK